ncbi:SixA phosphatase family protein [Robertkochia sediminum]|uniref:SixA phosphatase family protein n=1 Tax=Robertkochia sediminum TaxID=2785326 RepID=UPI0019312AD1|nr:phosphoglycerate mutase family protein [Robertkochia sediminum]MBL7473422.1 histidine phosphatase family protein [Robertkochia sediminum]
MRTTLLSMFFIGFLLSGCTEFQVTTKKKAAETPATVFYLIRHAEKDRSDAGNRDPELTPEGLQRATYWKEVFREIPLAAVYSTNYNRTYQTALPTAQAKDLEVLRYEPDTTDLKHWAAQYPGKHILIVGHSNTTPALANQLMGEGTYTDIDDSNNGNLYIVQYGSVKNSSVLYLEPSYTPRMETP